MGFWRRFWENYMQPSPDSREVRQTHAYAGVDATRPPSHESIPVLPLRVPHPEVTEFLAAKPAKPAVKRKPKPRVAPAPAPAKPVAPARKPRKPIGR